MKTLNSYVASKVILRTISCPLLIFIFLSNSCKKDEKLLQATVLDGGAEDVDGCGWLITIGEKNYYPINLSTNYQTNGLKVLIRYNLLNQNKICSFPSSGSSSPKIEVLEIKNKK